MLAHSNAQDLILQQTSSDGDPRTNPRQTGCGAFILLSSVIAAVSGLLVGYELGIISGALLQLQSLLELTCQQQEIVVSALLIGAFVASLVGGSLIDLYGRRITIIFTSILLVFSNLLPVVIVSYELMIVVGILFAYICNYLFASVSNGWKYMFGLIIPLAALQAIAMYFLPQSPRFLIMKGYDDAAGKVLQKLRATTNISEELTAIKSSIKAEYQYRFLDLFCSRDNMRVRLLIGLTLSFFVQITGQPNILFYASTVLKSVGFQSTEAASLASTGIGVIKVVSTIPAIIFVDKIGSKTFLCIGSAVMAVSLVSVGLVSLQLDVNFNNICKVHTMQNHSLQDSIIYGPLSLSKPNESLFEETSTLESTKASYLSPLNGTKSWHFTTQEVDSSIGVTPKETKIKSQPDGIPEYMKWLCLASLLAFVAAFSIGLGPMAWLVQSEIFPAGIKGRAFAITSSMNWGMNLLISLTFLTLTEIIGLPWMLFGYALMSIASLVFVIMFVPNTKGRPLEEISMELANRSYVCNAVCYSRRGKRKLTPMALIQNSA